MTQNFSLIECERLILRMPGPENASLVADYYLKNKVYLSPFEPTRKPEFWTAEHWQKQLQINLDGYKQGSSLKLFIFLRGEEPVVGSINFTAIARGPFQACNLGYSLAENQQGKGYMTEALRVAIQYCFTTMNLHRIMANYLPSNARSEKLLKRCGFVVEGLAKNYLQINGQWEDHVLSSLTNPTWQEK